MPLHCISNIMSRKKVEIIFRIFCKYNIYRTFISSCLCMLYINDALHIHQFGLFAVFPRLKIAYIAVPQQASF